MNQMIGHVTALSWPITSRCRRCRRHRNPTNHLGGNRVSVLLAESWKASCWQTTCRGFPLATRNSLDSQHAVTAVAISLGVLCVRSHGASCWCARHGQTTRQSWWRTRVTFPPTCWATRGSCLQSSPWLHRPAPSQHQPDTPTSMHSRHFR